MWYMQRCWPGGQVRRFSRAGEFSYVFERLNRTTGIPARGARTQRSRTRIVMTDKKNPGETLTVTPTKTLTLKRSGVEQGVVRQSFSHGRTKQVVVEKVKRRMVGPGEAKLEPAPAAAPQPRRAPPMPSGR